MSTDNQVPATGTPAKAVQSQPMNSPNGTSEFSVLNPRQNHQNMAAVLGDFYMEYKSQKDSSMPYRKKHKKDIRHLIKLTRDLEKIGLFVREVTGPLKTLRQPGPDDQYFVFRVGILDAKPGSVEMHWVKSCVEGAFADIFAMSKTLQHVPLAVELVPLRPEIRSDKASMREVVNAAVTYVGNDFRQVVKLTCTREKYGLPVVGKPPQLADMLPKLNIMQNCIEQRRARFTRMQNYRITKATAGIAANDAEADVTPQRPDAAPDSAAVLPNLTA